MMRSFLGLGVLLLAPGAMAQTPTLRTYDMATVALLPIEAAVDATPRTITGRAPVVVHRQEARVTETARLGAAVSGSTRWGGVEISLALPAGAELFRVTLGGRATISAYCSPETIASEQLASTSRHGRVCLSDEDGDKIFDRVGYMAIPTQWGTSADGASAVSKPARIVGGMIEWVAEPIAPVAYDVPAQPGIPPVTLEIVVTAARNAAMIEVTQAVPGGEHANLGSQTLVWARQIPGSVTIKGAEVDVQSFKDGALTIQLVRGVPVDAPVTFVSTFPPAPPPPKPKPKPAE